MQGVGRLGLQSALDKVEQKPLYRVTLTSSQTIVAAEEQDPRRAVAVDPVRCCHMIPKNKRSWTAELELDSGGGQLLGDKEIEEPQRKYSCRGVQPYERGPQDIDRRGGQSRITQTHTYEALQSRGTVVSSGDTGSTISRGIPLATVILLCRTPYLNAACFIFWGTARFHGSRDGVGP